MSKSLEVSINCGFENFEQRIVWEAVVVPEISAVLCKYAPLLLSDESEEKEHE